MPRVGIMATNRIRTLRKIISTIDSIAGLQVQESCVARVTIDLQNTWSQFSRALYLSSLLGSRLQSGRRATVSNPCADIDDAIGRAVRQYRPSANPRPDGSWHRRDEPNWHDPNILLALLGSQNATILTSVQESLSSGYRVFLDLPVFRNYFAHRSQQNAEAARSVALRNGVAAAMKRPSDMLLTRPIGRPQSLLNDWIDELQFTIDYVCI